MKTIIEVRRAPSRYASILHNSSNHFCMAVDVDFNERFLMLNTMLIVCIYGRLYTYLDPCYKMSCYLNEFLSFL